ncbi:hypothetical protein [Rhizobium sp. LCM 4573]|uniref:SPW repeat domain-containing protein n=1 Tax=Rhizobium sp. LCM 4573 TaxID=1848291 RepID=UPI0008D9F597|nr:hypothetical protein [Rhizobium sp. LCM 4573]OHV78830.1 hypothetical protein LCM4573_26100 [Rhizobium sp. LCM 4573]
MRFIPTLAHGIADYVVGLLVIALPFLLGLDGAVQATIVVFGAVVLLYSAITDYELGLVRFLRIRFHLLLDALFGIVMLVLPTTFGIPADVRWPFYVLGVLALMLTITTKVRAEGTAAS